MAPDGDWNVLPYSPYSRKVLVKPEKEQLEPYYICITHTRVHVYTQNEDRI